MNSQQTGDSKVIHMSWDRHTIVTLVDNMGSRFRVSSFPRIVFPKLSADILKHSKFLTNEYFNLQIT